MNFKNIQLLAALILVPFCFATAKDNVYTISGYVDPSITAGYANRELTIRFVNYISVKQNGKTIAIPIAADNTFRKTIQIPDSLFYATFEIENKSKTNSIDPGYFTNLSFSSTKESQAAYLFRAGDSIDVAFGKAGHLYFTGRGSQRMNCQWELYNVDPHPKSVGTRLSGLQNEGKAELMLNLLDTALDQSIRLRLALLNTYRLELTAKEYEALRLDAIVSAQTQRLQNTPPQVAPFDNEVNLALLKQHFDRWTANYSTEDIDTATRANSPYYSNYILRRMQYAQGISKRNVIVDESPFKNIYDSFKSHYSGRLRDKLIYNCFYGMARNNFTVARSLIDDALQTVETHRYKQLLTEIKSAMFRAFPFELYDADNKIHRLADYRGKLVIIDFWFTGCGPCELLAEEMDTIVKQYKGRNDIVFISLSPDRKEKWLKSVASGKYTSKEMVNLHTNGLGFAHPFIKYYNFTGAPVQYVISKTGDLITSSPPRPSTDKSHREAFIKLIEDNL